ncbi:hypothetical protein [Enterococcus sp. DIV1304_2]|uniref:hypothetical protein n=1 Tax=unclassified Enterococcus TaxID=2608891 RepID=UPI003D2FE4C8
MNKLLFKKSDPLLNFQGMNLTSFCLDLILLQKKNYFHYGRSIFMANYNPNRLMEMAKQKNILDVASSLGLELKRAGHQYVWIEHPSFKIHPRKNTFSWYSKGNELRNQDVIKMVEVINNMSFKEALHYLLETEAGVFDGAKIPKKEPFIYRVREANTFDYARKYLREERGLSDETIDFFLNKGIMVQGIHKDFDTGKTEPMIVFKHVDIEGKIVGGARQGIWYNKQLYPEKGRLKKTLYNSEGTSGVIVDIGDKAQFSKATSENPFTVYAFEAPIDMMSYYELHKNQLSNCRLVAMNGLNKGIISRAVVEALCADKSYVKKIEEKVSVDRWLQKIDDLAGSAGVRHEKLKIVLALDNDAAKFNPERGKIERPAKDFYNSFGINNIDVIPHFPKCHEGMKKNDWNDELKYQKGLLKGIEATASLQQMINNVQQDVATKDLAVIQR